LLLGAGLFLAHAHSPSASLRSFGIILSIYGAFALAALAPLAVLGPLTSGDADPPAWAAWCGLAGMILAFSTAAVGPRSGSIFAGISIALVLAVTNRLVQPAMGEPWFAYALQLAAMLCLVVSGMLDGARARTVAGWLGLAAVIASITWAVNGSLLERSAFLGAAGAAAIALAMLLGRMLPKESRP
jgi:hypothetical protein